VDTPIIIGTETEYGIAIKNVSEQDPVAVSTLVVNIYKDNNLKKLLGIMIRKAL
jgi:proteasome accessory factor A